MMSDFYLMMEVIILEKIKVTMSLNWKKKTCGDESHEKQNKHIYASASDLEHIRKGNVDILKAKQEK